MLLIGIVLLVLSGIILYLNVQVVNKDGDPTNNIDSPFKNIGNTTPPDKLSTVDCELAPGASRSVLDTVTAVPGIKPDAKDNDDYWIMYVLQPVVLDYYTKGGVNYMIAGLKLDDGTCTKVNVALSGQIDVVNKSDNVDPTKIKVNTEIIEFEEFKSRFPGGTQLAFFYLGRRPEERFITTTFCALYAPSSERYCAIQRISEVFSKNIIGMLDLTKFPAETDAIYAVNWTTDLFE